MEASPSDVPTTRSWDVRRVSRRTGSACSVLLLAATLGGCAIAPDVYSVGLLAVGANAAGQPVVVMELCDSGTPDVEVSAQQRLGLSSAERADARGRWDRVSSVRGLVELTPTNPSADYDGPALGQQPADRKLIVSGGAGSRGTFNQVGFSFADVARLKDGQLMVGNDVMSRQEFLDRGCRS